MITQTKETQSALTPATALQMLKDGNKRFLANSEVSRSLLTQVSETQGGQFPFAVVLSCIDSRVPVELVLDQGIGDLFSIRVAGNVVNEDVLGSAEYACKVAGSKVVVVMGHSKCGAVTAACQGVELGNITPLLAKIQPAVASIKSENVELDGEGIEKVVERNVTFSADQIRKESSILAEMESAGEITIIEAMYDVASGKVDFK